MLWNVSSLQSRCLPIPCHAALHDMWNEPARNTALPCFSLLFLARRSSLYLQSGDSFLPLASPVALTTGVILFCTPVCAVTTCFSLWVLDLGMYMSPHNTPPSAPAPAAFSVLSDPGGLYLPSCFYFWGRTLWWLLHPASVWVKWSR